MRKEELKELKEELAAFTELSTEGLNIIEERYRDAARIDCTVMQFQTLDEHVMQDLGRLLLEVRRVRGLPLDLDLAKEWGTCELHSEHTERELFTCSDCDRAVCFACIRDAENWLCEKCDTERQEGKIS